MKNHQPTDPPKPYCITSQVEDAEIVPWLRINAEHASRASHPSWLMFCVAADAIERLTTERDAAREKVARIMEGLEGCCMTCEPVGMRNQQMEREIAMLQERINKTETL